MVYTVLDKHNISILVADIKENSIITIGTPHHTPGGVLDMRSCISRVGDENVGYLGFHVADMLKCSFICACNYFIDPNKSMQTDYSKAIIKSKPKYLIEIHGHGKRNSQNDVEISCGSRQKEDHAIRLQMKLTELIGQFVLTNSNWEDLRKIKIEAEFDKIFYRATKTATITEQKWEAYHIELSPMLRKDNNSKVPEIGLKFSELLARAIKEICI
ncbi:MAG: hypothetical protein AB1420_12440 [Bacillota bacterium]